MKTKNNFDCLICSFVLFICLKIINDKIQQFDFEFLKNDKSHIVKKFEIFVENNSFEYFSIDNI